MPNTLFGCFVCAYGAFVRALTPEERDQVRQALAYDGGPPRMVAANGEPLALPEVVLRSIVEVIDAAADGCAPLVLRSPDDLTTEQAALVLGVSRPTVVRMIEAGKLPAHMVGTHRRLALDDVVACRELSRGRRRDALDQMTRQAEAHGLYG